MKILIIPDLHGKSIWQLMVQRENPDKVIFLGDYMDSFNIPYIEQMHNLESIIRYKELHKKSVVLLIGNHDYISNIHDEATSGYQVKHAIFIKDVYERNKDLFKVCHKQDEFLFSHAGVSHEFMDDNFSKNNWDVEGIDNQLNELFKYKPHCFKFNGSDPYGDNKYQTPVWIRPGSLMSANKNSDIKKKLIQIVGHTKTERIDFEGKSTGGRYYFVDTLDGKHQEYLTIIDGQIKLNNL